ncbi:hypothetical protein [uncultured Croceitalea sp.]|uniref:hypothetical protein n=1 Tax=uncultured Croceitalea sp. TaxID=1798908 RepID=UPI0033056090
MKSIILSILCLLFYPSTAFTQKLTNSKAAQTINKLIKENNTSKGFHSLDLFALKKMGDKNKVKADDTNIYCEQEIRKGKMKDRIFPHKDIKKIVVLNGKKASYGVSYVDDFQVLIHYKQMGKLVIVGIDAKNLDFFIEAVKTVAPNIKKVTYAK